MAQCISDPGTFVSEYLHRPGLQAGIATVSRQPVNHLKRADYHVVGISQLEEILALLRSKRAQEGHDVCSRGRLQRQLQENIYILIFILNCCGHGTPTLLGWLLVGYDESCSRTGCRGSN